MLEVGEYLVRLSAVDVALREELELLVGAVELARELEDLREGLGLLCTELVAREGQNLETLGIVLVIQVDKCAIILFRETSEARHVHDGDNLAPELTHVLNLTVHALHLRIVERGELNRDFPAEESGIHTAGEGRKHRNWC